MKHWWQIAAVGLAGLVLGVFVGRLVLGGGYRPGMVDMDAILTKSKPGQDYQAKLDARAKELDAQLAKIANAQERAAKREQFRNELTALQKEYTNKVLAQADAAVAKVAKRRGIGAVFVRGTLRYAAFDLTEEVLKELAK
ncbi:MAG: OmpH family outer membrane protein [Bacteroidota bacterium]